MKLIDLDQLMKYPLRRGSEHCDGKNADPRFLNGVESILEWAQTLPTLTPPNEPLTLEELREINEEPIYVTTKNYGDGWCILNWHGVNKSYTYFSRTGTAEGMTATPLSAKTYGDLWLAYRRPPEEVLKDGSTTD